MYKCRCGKSFEMRKDFEEHRRWHKMKEHKRTRHEQDYVEVSLGEFIPKPEPIVWNLKVVENVARSH